MEHDEQAERMERDADRMKEHSDEVGERIEEAREGLERRESDQLPEEQPAEAVPEDDEGGRQEPRDPPGVPGEEGTATGNPDAAGAEDPDE